MNVKVTNKNNTKVLRDRYGGIEYICYHHENKGWWVRSRYDHI